MAFSQRRIELRTDFADLDTLLGGLTAPTLFVIASRPSHGKTSLALNIARNVAVGQGAQAAIFSLEMNEEQLMGRLLASESGLDSTRLRVGSYTEADEQKMLHAKGVLAEADIHIARAPVCPIDDLCDQVRRLHSRNRLDLVVFDYVELIPPREDNEVRDSTAQDDVARSMWELSRELGAVVIACLHLPVAPELRVPHVPKLSDLEGSGGMDDYADVVAFVYREDMYTTEEEWRRIHPNQHYPKGTAQIIIAKHRNGPTGVVTLRFRKDITRFEDLATRQPEPAYE